LAIGMLPLAVAPTAVVDRRVATVLAAEAGLHYSCVPPNTTLVRWNGPQLWALGLQKTGSTIMSTTIAAALHAGLNEEAVAQCCCKGSLDENCNAQTPFSPSECLSIGDIGGSLFGGNMATFVSTCGVRRCDVIKADDLIWDLPRLHIELTMHERVAPRILFFVRHPVHNIRALLAWCTEDDRKWDDADSAAAACTAKLQRLRRVQPNQDIMWQRPFLAPGNKIATTAVDIARMWQRAVHVYLDHKDKFVGVMRLEDFSADPVHETRRAIKLAFGEEVLARVDDSAVLQTAASEAPHRHHYEVNNPSAVFNSSTTKILSSMLSAEIAIFNYTL